MMNAMNTTLNTTMNTNAMDTTVELRQALEALPQEYACEDTYRSREERIKAAMIVYGD